MRQVDPPNRTKPYRSMPLVISGSYVLSSLAWITLSDTGLSRLFPGEPVARYSMLKGSAFVLVTGGLLYGVLRGLALRIRKTEGVLAESAQQLRDIVTSMDELVATVGWDERILRAYGTWVEKLGVTPEELTGRSLTSSLPTANENSLHTAVAAALHGHTQRVELMVAGRNGVFVLEASLSPVKAETGRVDAVLLVGRDVTAYRQTEATLERYRLLVEHTPDIVVFVRSDGRILDANRAAAAAYGYTVEELRQLAIDDIRGPHSGEFLPEELSGDSHFGTTYETNHRRRDSSIFPVEVSLAGAPIAGSTVLVKLVRDITERRVNEEAGRLLSEIDRLILQNQPADQVLQYLCDRLCTLFDCGLVWIGLRRPDGSVKPRAVSGDASDAVVILNVRWDAEGPDGFPSGAAIRTGMPKSGVVEPGSSQPWMQLCVERGAKSYLALPLNAQGQTVGSLTLYSRRPDAFSPTITARLQAFASQVALSILTAESQEQIRLQTIALENTANAVMIADRKGTILWINAAFCHLTGYEPEEAIGQTPRILKSGSHSDVFYENLWNTILAGKVWRGELNNRRKDGTTYIEEQTITPVRDADGKVTHFVSIRQDVTERKRYEELLQHLALHDPLTDLPNRRALDKSLEVAVGRGACGLPSALLILDIDHFKILNDTVGHATGDQFLIAVAKLLANLRRPGDMLARIGGDEFALLLDDASIPDAQATAERVRQAVESFRFHAGSQVFEPTVSIGLVPVDGTLEREGLMVLADAALYAAKDQGKNRAVFFGADQHPGTQTTETARWAYRIKDALRNQQFVLYYQPVVRLGSMVADHHEALIRLREPGGSITGPTSFLQAAEQFRLMPMIDRWVVDTVLAELRNRPSLRIFVNLSGQSLSDESLLVQIETMVKAEPASLAGRLTFEITETAAVRDLGRAQQWMRHLTDLGCRFALDDFGMGFSSFSYLKALPARYVKIDGSFIRNLDTDPTNRALVQSMTTVAHALGKAVVAEWVENEQIARLLGEIGVEYGQGYGLGVPSPELPSS